MEQQGLVPISHYLPKTIKISENKKNKYYYPPKRKYLRLDVIQLYISEEEVFDWMTVVVFGFDLTDKYSYEWFNRYMSEFYPGQDKFPYAKDYLINKFIYDLEYFRNNFSKHNNKIFIHREDLIKFWYENQYKEYGVVYDFTNVPELNEYQNKLSLVCLNPGPDGNPLGECSSVVNYFLMGKLMESRILSSKILHGWKIKKKKQKTFLERHTTEEIRQVVSESTGIDDVLIKLGEVRNGWNGKKLQEFIEHNNIGTSHFSSSEIKEYYKNPKLCPICGKPIPYHAKGSARSNQECCSRECSLELKRRRSFENFVKKSKKVHGDSYEYKLENFKGMKKNMLIHDKIFNEDFYQQPGNHERGFGNPTRSMSSGERLVYLWILNNNLIEFTKYQYILDNEIQGTNTTRVIIDFRLVLEEKEYWIEYNGEQHYIFRSNGIFSFNSSEYGETREEQVKSGKKLLDAAYDTYAPAHKLPWRTTLENTIQIPSRRRK